MAIMKPVPGRAQAGDRSRDPRSGAWRGSGDARWILASKPGRGFRSTYRSRIEPWQCRLSSGAISAATDPPSARQADTRSPTSAADSISWSVAVALPWLARRSRVARSPTSAADSSDFGGRQLKCDDRRQGGDCMSLYGGGCGRLSSGNARYASWKAASALSRTTACSFQAASSLLAIAWFRSSKPRISPATASVSRLSAAT